MIQMPTTRAKRESAAQSFWNYYDLQEMQPITCSSGLGGPKICPLVNSIPHGYNLPTQIRYVSFIITFVLLNLNNFVHLACMSNVIFFYFVHCSLSMNVCCFFFCFFFVFFFCVCYYGVVLLLLSDWMITNLAIFC